MCGEKEYTQLDAKVRGIEERFDRYETNTEKKLDELSAEVKEMRNELMKRLPVWATILVSVLTAACAWFAKG